MRLREGVLSNKQPLFSVALPRAAGIWRFLLKVMGVVLVAARTSNIEKACITCTSDVTFVEWLRNNSGCTERP